jgi:hypothetical protein
MRKILAALVASALIGATALTTSSPVNAGWGWPFFWVGVADGAIVGGALAAPYYRPYPYYITGLAMAPTMGQAMGANPYGMATPGYAAATEVAA